MNTVIQLSLTPEGIERAIREIGEYQNRVERKTEELRRRVAEMIRDEAQMGFLYAIANDLLNEPAEIGGVDVTTHENGDISVVIATGKQAVFIEFGAGVWHNGAVGNAPNPWGADLGFTIGSYGPKGARNVWGFRGEDGEIHLTHGVPASMPMYRAVRAITDNIAQIAREVFST